MDAFKAANVDPVVDQAALEKGQLVLNFDWPLDDKVIPLKALYPDGYPFLRPQIFVTNPVFFPKRHYSPIDGNLCLLGRDSRQWRSSWTVPKLLSYQLRSVFSEDADEDPQGEPAEVWWNSFGLPDSYCLIDSSWSILPVDSPGRMKISFTASTGKSGKPVFRGVVKSITDANGKVVATWTGPLPHELRDGAVSEMEIPWERSAEEILPEPRSQNESMGLAELLRRRMSSFAPFDFNPPTSKRGQISAFLYPSEVQFQRTGDGWLFVLAHGKRNVFYPGKKDSPSVDAFVVRTLRAGSGDLSSRAPSVSKLSTKSVAVIGTGAIGAPLAIELARNGVRELRLLDFDVIEPGNTVRWPLGATFWGQLKSEALAGFIENEYPATKVHSATHCLGTFSNNEPFDDSSALADALDGVDLVVDGTASFGATGLIWDETLSRSLPLVVLYASPSVAGGVVAVYAPTGGCPVCLEDSWRDEPETIAPPPGMFEEAELVQPPGCAERTFSGTFFDLQELSLQAMRVAAKLLADNVKPSSSTVFTLSFREEDGVRIPSWRRDNLRPHPGCACQKE
jgi:hypothetical protein